MISPNAPAFRTDTLAQHGELTVRVYLAGLAMQGLCANKAIIDSFNGEEVITAHAVKMADCLIAALNKPTS